MFAHASKTKCSSDLTSAVSFSIVVIIYHYLEVTGSFFFFFFCIKNRLTIAKHRRHASCPEMTMYVLIVLTRHN